MFETEDTVATYNLAAPKENRGGLGSLLMWYLIREAKRTNKRHLLLQPSGKAVKLYEKLGFVQTSKGDMWMYGSIRLGLLSMAIYWIVYVVSIVNSLWEWWLNRKKAA